MRAPFCVAMNSHSCTPSRVSACESVSTSTRTTSPPTRNCTRIDTAVRDMSRKDTLTHTKSVLVRDLVRVHHNVAIEYSD
eukprot:scaffold57356_cov15-Prasinocladus_malaysianus.AAC.1